jgi:hypothetical protein
MNPTRATAQAQTATALAVPAITSVTLNQGPISGGNTVTITGTALNGATAVKFGTAAAAFTVMSATQITATASAGTAGAAQVTVTTPGGVSNGVTYTYSPAPAITTLAPAQGPISGANTVTITGTGLTGASAVRFDDVQAAFTVVSGTQITATAPAHVVGTAQVTVTTPGGSSPASPYFYVAVPSVTSLSPDKGPVTAGATVVITGTGLLGASAVQFGTTSATFTVVSDNRINAVAPALSAGPVTVTVTTPGGTSSGNPYVAVAVPVISSVTLNQGPVAGGNTVTITGTGLSGTTAVKFGPTPAAFSGVSATQVTTVAPAGSAGAVQLGLTTPGGVSNAMAYTYSPAPAITTLTPAQGTTSGGTTVTITGTGFTGVSSVRFDDIPALYTVVSATQITATAPSHAVGAAQVTVTTGGGTSSSSAYFYVAVPTVGGVYPHKGPVTGGTTTTITGTGLLGTTAVQFGVTSATFTVVSATQVTATAPAGTTGETLVSVVTPGGASNGAAFEYVPVPAITTLTPSQGPASGGDTLAITGTDLSGATEVRFGSDPATITVVSPTQITVVTPAGTPGGVQVAVVTPGGVSNDLTYTCVARPGI